MRSVARTETVRDRDTAVLLQMGDETLVLLLLQLCMPAAADDDSAVAIICLVMSRTSVVRARISRQGATNRL